MKAKILICFLVIFGASCLAVQKVSLAVEKWELMEKEVGENSWKLFFKNKNNRNLVTLHLRDKKFKGNAPAEAGNWKILYEGDKKPEGFEEIVKEFQLEIAELEKPVFEKEWDMGEEKKTQGKGVFVANAPRVSGDGHPPHPAMQHQGLLLVLFFGLLGVAIYSSKWINGENGGLIKIRSALLSVLCSWLFLLIGAALIQGIFYGDETVVVTNKNLGNLNLKSITANYFVQSDEKSSVKLGSKKRVFIFGESTARGVPFGDEWAFSAWAAKQCDAVFVNTAIGGATSSSWVAMIPKIKAMTRPGDLWVLGGGHNDHFGKISGPPPIYGPMLWLPGAKHPLFLASQWAANSGQKVVPLSQKNLPFSEVNFAIDPPSENLMKWNLKKWAKAGTDSGARVLLLELPGCSNCGQWFNPFKAKPSPPFLSRGKIHTKVLMDQLRIFAEEGGYRFIPLPSALHWQGRDLENRLTVDNHHPVLEVQVRMGMELAKWVPGCKGKQKSVGEFHLKEWVDQGDYVRRLSQGLNKKYLKGLKLKEFREAVSGQGVVKPTHRSQ